MRHRNPGPWLTAGSVLRSSRLVPLLLTAPLVLGGCAMPPVVTLASLAADGVSYVTTGKSVSDHGISAATSHDCALMRPVFTGKPMCVIDADRGKNVPVEVGRASVPRPVAIAASRDSAIREDGYVRIGSYRDYYQAARVAGHYDAYNVTIMPVKVGDTQYYWVMAGPLSKAQVVALKARLAAAG